MRTQFQTLNSLITISLTMTRILQQVDFISQKIENQSQGLIFNQMQSLSSPAGSRFGPCNGKAHVVIGCICRHPSASIDDFTRKLDELIKNLKQKKLKVYILGNINIDFLKCNGHSPTEDHLGYRLLFQNNARRYVFVLQINRRWLQSFVCGPSPF